MLSLWVVAACCQKTTATIDYNRVIKNVCRSFGAQHHYKQSK
ncbi:hypothetical protein AOT82_192 [Psychrobacter sp. AntiMn-1]|nr:hypothetical protein AOT82_192 [Psychrobacter sp. AntiMn-1]